MPGLMRRVALIGVLLAGCATTRAAEPEPIAWPAVPLATMGFPSTATQSVTVTRAGNTIDFTALIESDQTIVCPERDKGRHGNQERQNRHGYDN